MVITGAPHAGKTALAHELLDHGIPNYDSDGALGRLLTHDDLRSLPLAQKLREQFGKDSLRHLGLVSRYIVSSGLSGEFASFVVKELPVEAELFMIEGEAFRHKEVQKALFAQLSKAGIRSWLMERAS
jgi:hypothetical protein